MASAKNGVPVEAAQGSVSRLSVLSRFLHARCRIDTLLHLFAAYTGQFPARGPVPLAWVCPSNWRLACWNRIKVGYELCDYRFTRDSANSIVLEDR